MHNTITGKPSSFHCGPEIHQMKLNNNWMKQVIKNPNWLEADQLGIYSTSAAEELKELNEGLPGSNPASGQSVARTRNHLISSPMT